jgi:hypothetical protein
MSFPRTFRGIMQRCGRCTVARSLGEPRAMGTGRTPGGKLEDTCERSLD